MSSYPSDFYKVSERKKTKEEKATKSKRNNEIRVLVTHQSKKKLEAFAKEKTEKTGKKHTSSSICSFLIEQAIEVAESNGYLQDFIYLESQKLSGFDDNYIGVVEDLNQSKINCEQISFYLDHVCYMKLEYLTDKLKQPLSDYLSNLTGPL
jgi:hypothetical protein